MVKEANVVRYTLDQTAELTHSPGTESPVYRE